MNLAEWDVLSVEKSVDGYYIIKKSTKSIDGKIDSISFNDNENFVVVDGTEYAVSKGLLDENGPRIRPGESRTLLLDVYGKIAGVKEVSGGNMQNGYLCKLSKRNQLDGYELVAEIFTLLGERKKFEFAKRVVVDGIRMSSNEANADGTSMVEEAIRRGYSATNPAVVQTSSIAQLLRYQTDSEGKINKIDTAYHDAKEDEQTLKRIASSDGSKIFYKQAGGKFNNNVLVDSDTIVFVVSLPFTGDTDADFFVSSGSYFGDNNDYVIEAFSYTKDKIISDLVVCYLDNTKKEVNSYEMIVDRVSQALDASEIVMQVAGYYNGSYQKIIIKNNAYTDYEKFGLEQGDLIRFRQDSRGKIIAYDHVYSAKENEFTYTPKYQTNGTDKNSHEYIYATGAGTVDVGTRIANGYIYSLYENSMTFVPVGNMDDIEGVEQERHIIRGANIYVYDRKRTSNAVRLGDIGDLEAYNEVGAEASRVIIRSASSLVKTIFVVKQ